MLKKFPYIVLLLFLNIIFFSCSKENNNGTEQPTYQDNNFVNIDWNTLQYRFDSSKGIITLPSKAAEDVSKFSAVILPEGSYNPIRVITDIEINGDNAILKTSDGTLEDIFINQHFILSTETGEAQVKSNVRKGNIFYPSKIELIYQEETKSTEGKKISYSTNRETLELIPGEISFTDFQSSFDVGFNISFDFGEKKKEGRRIGSLNDAQVSVFGEFDVKSIVAFLKSSVGFSQGIDLTFLKVRFEFLVGYVPIVISIVPEIELSGASVTEERISFNSHFKGETGFHWKEKGENNCIKAFDSSSDILPLEIQKEYQATNIGANLNFNISLYESLSFALGFGPKYTVEHKTKKFTNEFASSSNKRFVEWGLNFDIDFSLLKHLEMPILDGFMPLSSSTIYSAPEHIQIVNEPQRNLKEDEQTTAIFKVTGIHKGDILPISNALVHFVTHGGKVNHEYIYTDEQGNAEVSFILDSNNNGDLSAELIGGNGEVLESIDNIQFYFISDDDPYIPTEEDCIVYYTRPKGTSFSDYFDENQEFCNRKLLRYSDYSSEDIPEDEVGGILYLDGPVYTIPMVTFSGVRSLRIPMSCKAIEDAAFMMGKIERVEILSAERIGANAFFGSKLKSAKFGKIKQIELQAFWGCDLETVPKFNEGLRSIGSSAFGDCKQMRGTPVFPESLQTIDLGAFDSCSSLEGTLTIPQTLDTLGYGAFNNCIGFSKIIVPLKFKEQYDERFKDDGSYKGFENCVFKNCKAVITYY